jgi:hypothetical protein
MPAKRAVIYARDLGGEPSIDDQVVQCSAFVAAHEWVEDPEPVVDTDLDEPGRALLMSASARGVQVIVAYSPHHLALPPQTLRRLRRDGVDLAYVTI